MTTTRSTKLAFGDASGGAWTPVYTVPAGLVVILKTVVLFENDAVGALGAWRTTSAGSGGYVQVKFYDPMDTLEAEVWEGWHVMDAEDRIDVYAQSSIIYWISGAVLPA